MKNRTELTAWQSISDYAAKLKETRIIDLFADSNRFNDFSIEMDSFLFDYSKNFVDKKLISLFLELAEQVDLIKEIEAMFNGEKINITENRAVFHTALRDFSDREIIVDSVNIKNDINRVKAQMKQFCENVHSGKFLGYTDKKITDVVNIGIGGSDLGPAMVCGALKPYAIAGINIHFVSNVDSTDIIETLKHLNPETTLFVIASKTFTTQETLRNANTAKKWFLEKTGGNPSNIAKHFIALSTNRDAVLNFGINPDNMFEFWDWVGGRYSLWSAIGLSIALYIGYDNFEKLLCGAYQIDEHFRTAPLDKNIPFIMAALGMLYSNFMGANSQAVIPYEQYLNRFPAFLQQLDMESNGKTITKDGQAVNYNTGAIIWGEPGTNAQHSFFQLIHQGSHLIPVDFIAGVNTHNPADDHHAMLLSNYFAQSEALMNGKNEAVVREELEKSGKSENEIAKLLPHKVFAGNRPSNSILYKELSPEVLGSLIALYEHKVFVQGILWNVNSFDQWGVELGKQLAGKILPELLSASDLPINSHDHSTNALINFYKKYTKCK